MNTFDMKATEMSIDRVMDSVTRFYSWVSVGTGLASWQLLVIALGALLILVLLLRHMRKTRLRRVHVIGSDDRSEIIGINLTGRQSSARPVQTHQTKQATPFAEETEENQSWGQTTKDWRQLRERIRYLEHDIQKHERTEKDLRERIAGLEKANSTLQSKLADGPQTQETMEQQTKEPSAHSGDKRPETSAAENLPNEDEHILKAIQSAPEAENVFDQEEQAEKTERAPAGTTASHLQAESAASDAIHHGAEHVSSISSEHGSTTEAVQPRSAENRQTVSEETIRQSPAQTEPAQRDHTVPLDIKELKAIADLAKRLQARGQQRQRD